MIEQDGQQIEEQISSFQIRKMLVAVNNYTGKTVDIIAHSMGSAVTRKAILGSSCFDNDELLGAPLTQMVKFPRLFVIVL